MSRLHDATAGFMARGYDAMMARGLALRSLDGTVDRQATLLAFDHVFLLAGVAFLLVLPLLAFLKTPEETAAGTREKIEVHME
jgi:DHA2 family multidrug resistance protein